MKNFYFIAVLGLLLVGCSPENDELAQYSNQSITADATAECTISAGADKSVTLTNDYVRKNLYGVSLLRNYYLSLLDSGVPRDGTFSPAIITLIQQYKQNNFQTFKTTYTVADGDCTDSVDLSITVVVKIDEPTCSAGEDKFVSLTNDYVRKNLAGVSLLKDYYLRLLDNGVSKEGTFSPSITSIINSYKANNLQTFTTTYTITEGNCTDSVELSIEVLPGPCNAGTDKSVTLTNSYVRKNLYGYTLLRNYYLSLLDKGVSREGTFSPNVYTLVKSYRENNFQTFSTVYTVTHGDCSDSTNLSITVVPD